jgi:hypothetical protein
MSLFYKFCGMNSFLVLLLIIMRNETTMDQLISFQPNKKKRSKSIMDYIIPQTKHAESVLTTPLTFVLTNLIGYFSKHTP